MSSRPASLIVAVALVGCAATPLAPELERAQALEAKHDDEAAIALYDSLLWTCEHTDRGGRDDCGEGATRKALLLENRDPEAALIAWQAAQKISKSPAKQARAWVRAATIADELGDTATAARLAWQCIETYPDEMPTDDALRLAVRIGRETDSAATADRLALLFERLWKDEIGDNILFAREELYREGGQLDAAVTLADDLWDRYKHSSLRDDAMWNVARALYAAGRHRDALLRLQKLIDTRRDALITGSYNSEFLDDAQLLKGQIALDGLHDIAMAIDCFSNLVGDWPESILRDDALMEWARAVRIRHAPNYAHEACALLMRILVEFPDGNQVTRATKERAELRCP